MSFPKGEDFSDEGLSWKEKKEEFFSGLKGTTLSEISVLVGYFPAFLLLRAILINWFPSGLQNSNFFRFVFDFSMMVLPFTLAVTELSNISTQVLLSVLVFAITALLFLSGKTIPVEKEKNISYAQHMSGTDSEKLLRKSFDPDLNANEELKQFKQPGSSPNVVSSKLPFVTYFRAFVSIATCVCILAVDFHVFPRRLAKTEDFGSGLMDVGVGMYVLSNALVSREARYSQKHNYKHLNFRALIFQIISSWPIVLLGIIRLVSVKLLGYNEHISEYGMHWNFFLTLACVKNLAAVIAFLTKARYSLFVFAAVAFSYQFVLVSPFYDTTEMLLNNEREGILMQNKEGLASCFGYLALYFAGVYFGRYLFKPRTSLKDWQNVTGCLIFVCATLWFLVYKCETEVQPISRRLANLAYILWVLATSVYIIVAILCIHIISVWYISKNRLPDCSMPDKWLVYPPEKSSSKIAYSPPSPSLCIMCAISRNHLLYFLVCNLATGVVNGLVDSLTVNNCYAVLIISAYQFFITLLIWYLHVKNITLKFW